MIERFQVLKITEINLKEVRDQIKGKIVYLQLLIKTYGYKFNFTFRNKKPIHSVIKF